MKKGTMEYNEAKWRLMCDQASACKDCTLHVEASRKVICDPPEYEGVKDVLFIGEGPGQNEDEEGLPFVGLTGQYLRDMIREMALPRDLYAITNIVMCRPPGNRDPEPHERQECRKWLVPKIRMLRPLAIVAVGKHAAQELLGVNSISILNVSGRPRETNLRHGSVRIDLPMMAIPHPRWGKANTEKYRQYFAKLDAWLIKLGIDERDPELA